MTSLVYERVHESLSRLGLTTMEGGLNNHLESKQVKAKIFMEILEGSLNGELATRRSRAKNPPTRLARLPFRKTFDEYDFLFHPGIDKTVIDDIRTFRFVHNAENDLFLGPPGVGKTHLAVALALAAITVALRRTIRRRRR